MHPFESPPRKQPAQSPNVVLGSPSSVKKPAPFILFVVDVSSVAGNTANAANDEDHSRFVSGIKVIITRILLFFSIHVDSRVTWAFQLVHLASETTGLHTVGRADAREFNRKNVEEFEMSAREYIHHASQAAQLQKTHHTSTQQTRPSLDSQPKSQLTNTATLLQQNRDDIKWTSTWTLGKHTAMDILSPVKPLNSLLPRNTSNGIGRPASVNVRNHMYILSSLPTCLSELEIFVSGKSRSKRTHSSDTSTDSMLDNMDAMMDEVQTELLKQQVWAGYTVDRRTTISWIDTASKATDEINSVSDRDDVFIKTLKQDFDTLLSAYGGHLIPLSRLMTPNFTQIFASYRPKIIDLRLGQYLIDRGRSGRKEMMRRLKRDDNLDVVWKGSISLSQSCAEGAREFRVTVKEHVTRDGTRLLVQPKPRSTNPFMTSVQNWDIVAFTPITSINPSQISQEFGKRTFTICPDCGVSTYSEETSSQDTNSDQTSYKEWVSLLAYLHQSKTAAIVLTHLSSQSSDDVFTSSVSTETEAWALIVPITINNMPNYKSASLILLQDDITCSAVDEMNLQMNQTDKNVDAKVNHALLENWSVWPVSNCLERSIPKSQLGVRQLQSKKWVNEGKMRVRLKTFNPEKKQDVNCESECTEASPSTLEENEDTHATIPSNENESIPIPQEWSSSAFEKWYLSILYKKRTPPLDQIVIDELKTWVNVASYNDVHSTREYMLCLKAWLDDKFTSLESRWKTLQSLVPEMFISDDTEELRSEEEIGNVIAEVASTFVRTSSERDQLVQIVRHEWDFKAGFMDVDINGAKQMWTSKWKAWCGNMKLWETMLQLLLVLEVLDCNSHLVNNSASGETAIDTNVLRTQAEEYFDKLLLWLSIGFDVTPETFNLSSPTNYSIDEAEEDATQPLELRITRLLKHRFPALVSELNLEEKAGLSNPQENDELDAYVFGKKGRKRRRGKDGKKGRKEKKAKSTVDHAGVGFDASLSCMKEQPSHTVGSLDQDIGQREVLNIILPNDENTTSTKPSQESSRSSLSSKTTSTSSSRRDKTRSKPPKPAFKRHISTQSVLDFLDARGHKHKVFDTQKEKRSKKTESENETVADLKTRVKLNLLTTTTINNPKAVTSTTETTGDEDQPIRANIRATRVRNISAGLSMAKKLRGSAIGQADVTSKTNVGGIDDLLAPLATTSTSTTISKPKPTLGLSKPTFKRSFSVPTITIRAADKQTSANETLFNSQPEPPRSPIQGTPSRHQPIQPPSSLLGATVGRKNEFLDFGDFDFKSPSKTPSKTSSTRRAPRYAPMFSSPGFKSPLARTSKSKVKFGATLGTVDEGSDDEDKKSVMHVKKKLFF